MSIIQNNGFPFSPFILECKNSVINIYHDYIQSTVDILTAHTQADQIDNGNFALLINDYHFVQQIGAIPVNVYIEKCHSIMINMHILDVIN